MQEDERSQEVQSLSNRAMLLVLMGSFLILWVVFPLLVPGTGKIIDVATLPFRLLGIFVHEMGHGYSAVLSGGSFLWFQMDLMGGLAITSGGVRGMTVLGGLLGPAFLGSFLLLVSTRSRNLSWVFVVLGALFVSGIYYMVKPLWLSTKTVPAVAEWHVGYLLSLIVPAGALVLTWFMFQRGDAWRRAFLQILGILMCYSAFCDNNYIFMYDTLSSGGFSDARVFGSLLWPGGPADLPRGVFNVVAFGICLLNMGLMTLGAWKALSHKSVR